MTANPRIGQRINPSVGGACSLQAYDTENVEKTFRKTPQGQSVFGTLAQWIAFKLAKSGFKLSAIGITKDRALIELQPLMPQATSTKGVVSYGP